MGLEEALAARPTGERPRFDAGGRLVGSRCARCAAHAWPGRAVCHRCGSAEVEERRFAGTATLLTFTEVMVARPGLAAPYTLGQVRVHDGGPILFGRVVGLGGEAALPCPVVIHVAAAADGASRYWFEPAPG